MKAWKISVLTVFLGLFIGVCPVLAEIGDLDTTFGEEGKVVTSFGQYGGQAYTVALQHDGKILAAGSAFNGFDFDLAIARYNPDGTLDTSFADDGKLRTSIGEGGEEINSIVVQDDGYIVVSGYMVVDGRRDFLMVRFTSDGNFDNSFGEDGIVHTEFGNLDDEITAMALDSEARIVVCGYVTGTAGKLITLARFDEGGELDITFGDDGIVLTDIGDDALARSIDIDEEGRIVVAGSLFHPDRTELMLLRFLDDGDFDTTFGDQGIAAVSNKERLSEGFGVKVLEEDFIMVAGTVDEGDNRDAALFRFSDSGQPDESFGDNGILVTSASDEDDIALALDVLGNVVGLSGYNTFNTKRDFLFVALEETTDEGTSITLNKEARNFKTGGVKYDNVFDLLGTKAEAEEKETSTKSIFNTTYFGFTDDVSYGVVLQPDGKAVSVGYTVEDGVSSFALARYISPVANSEERGGDPEVSWIITSEPTNVSRTGAYTGGTIFADGLTITQRGVVYSTVAYPTLPEGSGTDDGAPSNQICTENCAETQGACSSHDGVDCAAGPDSDGSVICNDGWRDSSVDYVCDTTASTAIISNPYTVAALYSPDHQPIKLLGANIGSFLVSTAHAQTTTTTTTETNSNSGVFSLTSPSYSENGSTDNGAGIGSFSAVLTNLRPGTVYYVRSYAKENNGKVYYGNQYEFKTADSCFIATAAFGSMLHPYVSVLRNFRDQYLESNFLGRKFVSFYYRHSPPVADFIASRSLVRHAVQVALLPLIAMSWLILQIGFVGLFLLITLVTYPSVLACRSYRKIEIR